MFSPYYAFAQRGGRQPAAEDHCAINVALYGDAGRRWAMTERGQPSVARGARHFSVGPSSLEWQGDALTIRLDERNVPWPHRVAGTVRVWPKSMSTLVMPLDDAGRHRWGPLAPCARVEVDMQAPAARWSGDAYLDANEGDEPISRPFTEWDWSRATLRDGSSAVVYDVRQKTGADRLLALRYAPGGGVERFEPPPRQALPRTGWRMARGVRSDAGAAPARVLQTLEDTPFYVRSVLASSLFGESVTSVHETLNVPRLVSPAVQFMLPWRMPRRR